MANEVDCKAHRLINTTFPVLLDETPELKESKEAFAKYIDSLIATSKQTRVLELPARSKSDDDKNANQAETTPNTETKAEPDTTSQTKPTSAFMDALLGDKAAVPTLDDRDDKMLTENADVAYRTSREPLVDLFYELEDVISADRLRDTLEMAWTADSESTLKIIWNARSIHLGKSSRYSFYRAVGWLYQNHPATLIANLPWLVRPIILKKAPKERKDAPQQTGDAVQVEPKDADSDFEVIEADDQDEPAAKKRKLELEDDPSLAEFDIKYGVAHGYWKDLLNILALAVNDELKVNGSPRKVLNVEKPTEKAYKRDWTAGRKNTVIEERHERAISKLKSDPVYKALHLTVARLFADQLRLDAARLESGSKKDVKAITLAAKWAPTHKGMHDQHTIIVSSIAEALYSFDSVCSDVDAGDRRTYLLHAREAYQLKTLPKLRKHLQIVERQISEEKFEDIKYDRIPSLAMKQYAPLFVKKDFDRFDKYIENVAQGKAKISGATLLPSTLVHEVDGPSFGVATQGKKTSDLVEKKMHEIKLKGIGGQWNTLVQRIKDSGTLESSIAVCDVSGSMGSPVFKDGTCPMDSAIGLSLLLAEITKPPFGGAMITFSTTPQVLHVGGIDDKRSFAEKVRYIQGSKWSMSTDFVAVFEKLILPMAIKHKLKQEDMVKQVFVFSDMQFDAAQYDRYSSGGNDRWTSSYERIQAKFKKAGYEMPKLIFWNLAGGRAGYNAPEVRGDDTAPKPVTAAEEGTVLVSGYSQGQLKMFLDNGQFDAPEEAEVIETKEGENGDHVVVEKAKKKQDPLAAVKKAISHEAYRMLKVVD